MSADNREPVVLPDVGEMCPGCNCYVPSKSKQGRHFRCITQLRRTAADAWRGRSDVLKGPALAEHRAAVRDAVVRDDVIR